MHRNLYLRVLSALVVVPLLLVLLFWGPVWGFTVLVLVATALGANEFFAMTHPSDRLARASATAMTVATAAAFYAFSDDARKLTLLMLAVPIGGMMLSLSRLGDIQTAAFRAVAAIAGPFYIGVLLVTLALLRRDLGPLGPHYVVLTLTIAWFGDTGGYAMGKRWGKKPLYAAVSPKKTREGLLGVVLGSLLAGGLAHFTYLGELGLLQVLLLSAVAGVLGQLGDLAESLIKRATGIKDSGSIVPGHGGLLDRIDAVLLVGPAVYVYATWLQPLWQR